MAFPGSFADLSSLWTGHRYAIKHSGLHRIKHRHNSVITLMVYALMGIVTLIFLSYTIMILGHKENWLMSATVQDPYDPDISNVIKARNKCERRAPSNSRSALSTRELALRPLTRTTARSLSRHSSARDGGEPAEPLLVLADHQRLARQGTADRGTLEPTRLARACVPASNGTLARLSPLQFGLIDPSTSTVFIGTTRWLEPSSSLLRS